MSTFCRHALQMMHLIPPHSHTSDQVLAIITVLGVGFSLILRHWPSLQKIITPLRLTAAIAAAGLLAPVALQIGARANSTALLSSSNSLLWADRVSQSLAAPSAGAVKISGATAWLIQGVPFTTVQSRWTAHSPATKQAATLQKIQPAATLLQEKDSDPSVHHALTIWLKQWKKARIVPLTNQTANRWLTRHIEQSLSQTDLYALGIAVLLLLLLFGSPFLALLSLMTAALATVYASAVIVLASLHIAISEYAVNIMNLLTIGLGLDYSIFLILWFRRHLRQALSEQVALPEAAARAYHSTRRGVVQAISLSAAILITVLSGMIFLPRPIGESLVLSAWVAVGCTYLTARLITLPVLRRWPQIVQWGAWPAGVDGLDHVYRYLQRFLKKAPGIILLVLFGVFLFGLNRASQPLTLTTPTSTL
ncbi:MAG: MMPL family transporter, partial [Firmicutes bacterium]|nr:MMPL family transporter [Bacillota bacterium]